MIQLVVSTVNAVCSLLLLVWAAWATLTLRRLQGQNWRTREAVVELGRRSDTVEGQVRGGRQQLANLIAMLLNAGFKPKRDRDWSDDSDRTSVSGEHEVTPWDWRPPTD